MVLLSNISIKKCKLHQICQDMYVEPKNCSLIPRISKVIALQIKFESCSYITPYACIACKTILLTCDRPISWCNKKHMCVDDLSHPVHDAYVIAEVITDWSKPNLFCYVIFIIVLAVGTSQWPAYLNICT